MDRDALESLARHLQSYEAGASWDDLSEAQREWCIRFLEPLGPRFEHVAGQIGDALQMRRIQQAFARIKENAHGK